MTSAHDDTNGAELQVDPVDECSRSASITGWCTLGAVLIVLGALAWAGAGAVLG